jgi:hypothetical protein
MEAGGQLQAGEALVKYMGAELGFKADASWGVRDLQKGRGVTNRYKTYPQRYHTLFDSVEKKGDPALIKEQIEKKKTTMIGVRNSH